MRINRSNGYSCISELFFLQIHRNRMNFGPKIRFTINLKSEIDIHMNSHTFYIRLDEPISLLYPISIFFILFICFLNISQYILIKKYLTFYLQFLLYYMLMDILSFSVSSRESRASEAQFMRA